MHHFVPLGLVEDSPTLIPQGRSLLAPVGNWVRRAEKWSQVWSQILLIFQKWVLQLERELFQNDQNNPCTLGLWWGAFDVWLRSLMETDLKLVQWREGTCISRSCMWNKAREFISLHLLLALLGKRGVVAAPWSAQMLLTLPQLPSLRSPQLFKAQGPLT